MVPTLVCVAKSQEQAREIVNRLRSAGFSLKDTSIVMPKSAEMERLVHEQREGRPEGAVLGAATGGALGILIGLATFVIPGLEPLLAVGPIVAALADAAAGGTVGAIAGALIGVRLSDPIAKVYEDAVKQGNIIISVHVADEAKKAIAKQTFEECGGEHIIGSDRAIS